MSEDRIISYPDHYVQSAERHPMEYLSAQLTDRAARAKGQGGDGTPPGDAIAILVYESHALFRPDGYNLRLDLPVTLDEAVLGGKVRVPTLEGAVDMTIPAGVTGSKAFRLRGKGLPDKGGVRGDIFVTPRIVLPDGADAGLEKLMERWREMRPYDVRGPEFSS